MTAVPHILIENLTLHYRSKASIVSALENVSIDIPPRSFVSVVGPSGCGKTTLLKVLSGVLKPTRGRALLDGRTIERAELSGKIGYVFQRPLLLPWRTALEQRSADAGDRAQGNASAGPDRRGAPLAAAYRTRPDSRIGCRTNCRAACSSACRCPARSPSDRQS